jgi:hypothetical protein
MEVRLELACCSHAVGYRLDLRQVESAAESEVRPFPRWNIPIVVALSAEAPVEEAANYADRTAEFHWDASRWSAGRVVREEAGEEGATKRCGGSLRLV